MPRAKINIKHKIVMYALGKYNEIAVKNVPKGMAVVLPKYVFINFVKKIKLIQKGERALYRNLEFLEKKKFIEYDNQDIKITAKGKKFYKEVKEEIKPFLDIAKEMIPKKIISKTKKLQTRFK